MPGSLRTSQDIPSTHHKLLSLTLYYLPFASRFPLPPLHPCRFTRPLFPFASLSLASCVLDCLSRWLKIILNCVISPIATTMIFLAFRLLLLPMLNLVMEQMKVVHEASQVAYNASTTLQTNACYVLSLRWFSLKRKG